MKKILRFTESDLTNLIREHVTRILRENEENGLALQMVAQGIAQKGTIYANEGENDVEVELGDNGIAYVMFNVDSNPYMHKGMRSNDYDVPDDPDEIVDDYNIEVISIMLDDESEIQDNGIVKKALEGVVEIDYDGQDIPSEKEFYGF